MVRAVPNSSGLIERRMCRQTRSLVALYDGHLAAMDTSAGRWQTVCEAHGSVCSHTSQARARAWMADPVTWCDACKERLT